MRVPSIDTCGKYCVWYLEKMHSSLHSGKGVLSKKLSRYPRLRMYLGLGFFEPFQYTIDSLNGQEDVFSAFPKRLVKRLDGQIKLKKKGNTLFILGSGPSINSLSGDQFDTISSSDSLGFNFWLHHWFAPSFYILQMPRTLSEKDYLIELMNKKNEEYTNCTVLLRGDTFGNVNDDLSRVVESKFGKDVYLHLPEFPISPDSSIPVISQLRFLDNLGFLVKGDIARYVPKPAGTLGLAIALGVQMGYDNIVLLGVDMNDTKHFYTEPDSKSLRNRLKELVLPNKGTFMDKGFGASHRDWIIGLSDYLREKKGVEIWLGTEGSSLRGEIPSWKW